MLTQPLGGTGFPASPPPDTVTVSGHAAPPHAESPAAAPSAQRVEAAIGAANRMLQAIDPKLHFQVDPETRITVIEVIDAGSNTVLRQIPAQEMLEIAQALDRMQGVLLRQKA